MNFLAHDAVLPPEAPALVRVSAALPDLWRLLPTPPLPLLLLRSLEASPDESARAVAIGVRAHLRADATFHRHPLFLGRVEWLAGELLPRWPGLGEPELAAHILVELLLDRWLLGGDPALATRFAASFSPAAVATAAHHGAGDPGSRQELARILAALGASPFAADHAEPRRFVARFERAWARSGFPAGDGFPRDALLAAEGRWAQALASGSAELVAEVRRAVRGAISPPPG